MLRSPFRPIILLKSIEKSAGRDGCFCLIHANDLSWRYDARQRERGERERDGRAEVLTSIIVGTIDPPQFGVCWGLAGGGRTDALMWELGRLSDPYRFSFFPDICVIGRRSCVMEALTSCEERGHLFRGNARASRVPTLSHESELMYFASCLGGGGKERERGSGVVESFMHAQSDNRERARAWHELEHNSN